MASIVHRLHEAGIISPPSFLPTGTHYETIMGSQAYGVSSENSDIDVYGFCIPPKEILFPHTAGVIFGFDKNYNRFDVYQQHHIMDGTTEYDLCIYNIVKYFRLCTDGNPNMVDSLFTPLRCVLSISRIGSLVRDNRKLFLSKKCWTTFKGYAYAQLHLATSKKHETSTRKDEIDKYGYSLKYAYHLVRLVNEVEQILTKGDIDLEENREQLKSIRRGEWTLDQIIDWFSSKEKGLESVYLSSTAVPQEPREDEIKELLLNILEEHYGSLDTLVANPDKSHATLLKVRSIIDEALR